MFVNAVPVVKGRVQDGSIECTTDSCTNPKKRKKKKKSHSNKQTQTLILLLLLLFFANRLITIFPLAYHEVFLLLPETCLRRKKEISRPQNFQRFEEKTKCLQNQLCVLADLVTIFFLSLNHTERYAVAVWKLVASALPTFVL